MVTKFVSQPALYRIGLRTRSVSESAHCHLIHLAVPVTMDALHLAVPVTRCQAHRTTVTTPASPTFWLKCHAWCYVDLCWVYIGWWLNFASPPGGVTPIFPILPSGLALPPPTWSTVARRSRAIGMPRLLASPLRSARATSTISPRTISLQLL